ncbi:HAD family phosphatase [Candidatus Saccharibacteria bacterium]|nr:HAD family phosphatase [Candidatus Saccharibacteria bacterium]
MPSGEGRDGLIIFDFDGVFNQNSTEAYREVYFETLKDVGIELSEEEKQSRINSKWGSRSSEIVRELVKEHPELFPGAVKFSKKYLSEIFPKRLNPIPGTTELLGRLVTRFTLAIDTAADRDVLVEKVMPKLNIDPALFKEIVTAEDLADVALSKPDPHTPQLIMEKLGFKPEQTVMVGDSENDVLAALYSDIEPIVPLTGNLNREEAEELGVNYVIADVTRLESALEMLGKAGIRPSFSYNL